MKTKIITAVVGAVVAVGAATGYLFFTRGNAPPALDNNSKSLVGEATKKDDDRFIGEDFSIAVPSGWSTKNQIPGTLVSIIKIDETHPNDPAAQKINFKSYITVSFDNAPDKTLADVVDFVRKQLIAFIPSAKVVSNEDTFINGQPAKLMEWDIFQQDVKFIVLTGIVLKGGKYFIIAANTPASKWTEYKDLFYNTLQSFEFKY